jgi:hypothetical protein
VCYHARGAYLIVNACSWNTCECSLATAVRMPL